MNDDQFTLTENSEGTQPFDVPKGYFDALPSRMSYRLESGSKAESKFNFEFIFRPAAIATIFMFVVATAVLTFNSPKTNHAQTVHSDETLLSYVEQEGILEELSEDELIEYIEEIPASAPLQASDSIAIEIEEELVNDDFIDFELYDEL